MEEHKENGIVCYFDKKHGDQKNYRDSASVWFTVPAMAKIQNKLGITIDTINQVSAVMLLGKMAGIEFTRDDFDRMKGAEIPVAVPQVTIPQLARVPQKAVADVSIAISQELVNWLKVNYPTYKNEARKTLEQWGNSKQIIDAHVLAAYPHAFKK